MLLYLLWSKFLIQASWSWSPVSGFHLNLAGPSTQNILLQYCVRRGLVMVADCAILPNWLSSLHSSCLSCSCTHAACWQICASQFSCDQCGKSIKLAKHLGGHKLDWLFNYHVSSMTQPPLHTLSNPMKIYQTLPWILTQPIFHSIWKAAPTSSKPMKKIWFANHRQTRIKSFILFWQNFPSRSIIKRMKFDWNNSFHRPWSCLLL